MSGIDGVSRGPLPPLDAASDAEGAGGPPPPAPAPARSMTPPGRMAAAVAATSGPPSPPKSVSELAARVAAMPRGEVMAAPSFSRVQELLKGRVTDAETDEILHKLDILEPTASWLATIDKLRTTPSDEPGKSLFEKFIRYGVDGQNHFIARFADQANLKLRLGLPSIWERTTALERGGMRDRKAERVAEDEIRKQSEVLLQYFDSADRQGFVNGLGNALKGAARGTAEVLAIPLVLLGVVDWDLDP